MDKTTPVRARCHLHPGVVAVAYCDQCGTALCLDCAVPVRGEVIGPECLATTVPETIASAAGAPSHPRRPVADRVALGGLALALLATLLPWARFGAGSRAFGAWGFSPLRHASAVGILATAGLAALWFGSRPSGPRSPRLRGTLAAGFGALIAVFSLLAAWHPVAFTRTSPAPFLAAAGGLVAALAWPVWARLRPNRSTRAVA